MANHERNYSPEYWDGHHGADECSMDGTSLYELLKYYPELERQQRQMRDRLAEQLEWFSFLQGGAHVSLAKFEKGNVFVPGDYPHGTLIRVASESLNFSYLDQGYEGYGSIEQFGFVVETQGITEDGKNGVLYIHGNLIYGGSPDTIKVGVVKHSRWHNYVNRINGVEIILMGSGRKKRVEDPAPRYALENPLPQLA